MKNSLLFMVLLSFGTAVFADNAAKEAERLLELSGTKVAMNQMTDMMLRQQLQQNPTLVPFENVLRSFFEKHIGYDNTKDALVKLYTDTFSEDELIKMNAFYETDVGQKSVRVLPDIMQRSSEIGTRRVEQNLDELQRMIADEAYRLKQLQTQDAN